MKNHPQKNASNLLSGHKKAILLLLALFVALIVAGILTWVIVAKTSDQNSPTDNTATDADNPDYTYDGLTSYSDQDTDSKDDDSADKKSSSKNKNKSKSDAQAGGSTAKSSAAGNESSNNSGNGSGNTKPTNPPASKQSPLLIKHGWDMPTASFVANNAASMQYLPFDGVVLRMNNGLSQSVQSQSPVTYGTFKSGLSSISSAALGSLKHNFLIVYSTPAGDIFSDWSTPVSNYANMAKAANQAGLEGIFFDNEEYFGNAINYPENCGSGKTLAQCRSQTQLRGKQIVNALRSTWPDVKIIVAHGAYISEDDTASYLNSHDLPWNDIAWANQLKGSFAIGMASATVGNSAQYIDGGEIYSARTVQHFKDIKYWQKQGTAANSNLIPSSLRSSWPKIVSSSFGIYDSQDLASGRPMNSSIWKSTLTNALNTTDRYVWAYTERHDWWDTGWPATPVSAAWLEATRQAYQATR